MILENCKFYLSFSFIIILALSRIDADNKEGGEARKNSSLLQAFSKDYNKICEELVQFTPNLCNNIDALIRCEKTCSSAAVKGIYYARKTAVCYLEPF